MSEQDEFCPRAFSPGPDAPGIWGFAEFLRRLLTDPVAATPAEAYRAPIAIRCLPGTRRPVAAFVTDPVALEQVLVERPEDFPKSLIDERVLRPAFGDSLLTASGDDWRWKRRLAAPYFTPAAVRADIDAMAAPFEALAQDWAGRPPATEVEVADAMTRTTLEVIRRVLFPSDGEIDVAALCTAIEDYLRPVSWAVGLAGFGAPAWLPHPGRAAMRDARRRMRASMADLVARQRRRVEAQAASGAPARDLCSALIGARDPASGRRLDDTDMTDMLLTLIAAGHETTANALALALHALARQPRLQVLLRAEARSVCRSRPVLAEDLAGLSRTEAFLRETLRLFPPAPLMARRTVRPETLAGVELPAGTTLFIPIYAIHRHASLWPEPDRFDISRHLGPTRRGIARTAWMPFGAGARNCIGASLAMTEMTVGLATILRAVRVSPASRAEPRLVHRVTLRPRSGINLLIAPATAAE